VLSDLLPYPIDMFPLLNVPFGTLDEARAQYHVAAGEFSSAYHPTKRAQYALAHWNAYLTHGDDEQKEAFMTHAHWLLAHESHLSNNASGWPITIAATEYHASQLWLSALTQGNAISVLMRAYQLTQEDAFLQTARRAVRTFELDILDGGVSTPIGDNGVFFEEVAVYPAAHILKGYILALFGLYDYITLTKDSTIEAVIQRSITASHTLIDAFDTGYWTYSDLLHKRLASQSCHSLHITLLEAFARYSGCEHCAALATRWEGYQHSFGRSLRRLIASGVRAYWDYALKPILRGLIYRTVNANKHGEVDRVCVPITAFPVAGGMRGVLKGVAQVMSDQWQMTYLTHHKGQGADGLEIEIFGRRIASPWQFPGVWLYCLSGWSKLFKLLHHGSDYSLILPQDGVFTAAFAALVGKMAGVRVVCMDHGNMTWLDNPALRMEWMKGLQAYPWYGQIFSLLRFACYWPSLHLLAWVATCCTDQFLVAGNEVEDVYRKRFGVHPSRIIRYAYMIDVARFTPPDRASGRRIRAEQGLSEDAIVITLINRLAAEKGLHFAIEGIALAVAALPPDVQARVKVLIVGDGPMHSQVEADIGRYHLETVCVLWGEATPSDVVTLLGIADIFLYTGTRGTNYSMAVLEAMAAGCAIIASVVPQSNAQLLAEGRGIAIMPASATDICAALVRLCSDVTFCHNMGQMAREYVTHYHNPLMLKRSLLRASFFVPSIESADSTSARHLFFGN